MPQDYEIKRVEMQPRQLAAIRQAVPFSELATTISALLDQVGAYLRSNQIKTGHNVIYYLDVRREASQPVFDAWFGVEAEGQLPPSDTVGRVMTPGGPGLTTVHVGPYDGLPGAHAALQSWAAENRVPLTHVNLEVYGEMVDDISQLRTEIFYEIAHG